MKEIHIITIIHIKKEFIEESLHALKKLVEASRGEKGNNQYDLIVDIKTPDNFVAEPWAFEQAIAEHSASQHFQEFVAFIDQKTTKLDISQLQPTSL